MAAINSVAELTIDGEVAVVTINSPPVNALSQAVRDGLKRGVEAAECRSCRQGDRPHLRRAHLHRRRRHFRIRQAARRALSPGRARYDRERLEAGRRRHPRHGARRRLRGGADRPLPHRRPFREMRPAGNQARPPSRRRRHAAAAAARRRREGARRHSVRRAVRRARGEGMGRRRRTRRGRQTARVRARLRPAADRRQGAAEEGARPLRQARACPRSSGDLRGDPQGERAKVPRLRGLAEGDRVGRRTRSTCRSTRAWRKSASCSWRLLATDPVQGAAPRVLRRAGGGQDRRRRPRRADRNRSAASG